MHEVTDMKNKVWEIVPIMVILLTIMLTSACASPSGDNLQTEIGNVYLPGTYKVGVDIPPGEYVIFGSGYMKVSSDSNGKNIITNNNYRNIQYISFKDRTYFEFDDGKAYPVDSAPIIDVSSGILPDRIYKIGRDIPAGEYKVSAFATGYWAVLSSSLGGSIVSNNRFEGDNFVTVQDGEYLELHNCELYLPALAGGATTDGTLLAEITNEFPGDYKVMSAVYDGISEMISEMLSVHIGNLQARYETIDVYRDMIAEVNNRYTDSNTKLANMISDTVMPLLVAFMDAADSFVQSNEPENQGDVFSSGKVLEQYVLVRRELFAGLTALQEFAKTPEALLESEAVTNVDGIAAKPESKYLVIAFEDAGIYVRSAPTVLDSANKILYIDAGNRDAKLRYLRETEITENGETHIWYQVALPDGRDGWVRDDVVIYDGAAQTSGEGGIYNGVGLSQRNANTVDIVDLIDNIADYSGKHIKIGGNLIIMYNYRSSEEQFFSVYLVQSGKVNTKYSLMVDYSKCENPRAASTLADGNAYVALEGTIMRYPGEDSWYLEAAKVTKVN
jgi:hypothetical protein